MPAAAVLPDGDGRLSDGLVVEARLRARLLGAPLLRVDGIVLVSPGRVVSAQPVSRHTDDPPGVLLARAAALVAANDAALRPR